MRIRRLIKNIPRTRDVFYSLTERTISFSSGLSITGLLRYLDIGFDLYIGALQDDVRIDEVSYSLIDTEILRSDEVFGLGIVSDYIAVDTDLESVDGSGGFHVLIGGLRFREHVLEGRIGLLELAYDSIFVVVDRSHYIGQSSDDPTPETGAIVLSETIKCSR